MTTDNFQPPESVSGLQRMGAIAAIVGIALAGVGFALSGLDRFYQAYLVAYTFWLGVVLGSMALLMGQHLSGGAWGVVIRRPLEAATSTLPAMAVLSLPIALGCTASTNGRVMLRPLLGAQEHHGGIGGEGLQVAEGGRKAGRSPGGCGVEAPIGGQ